VAKKEPKKSTLQLGPLASDFPPAFDSFGRRQKIVPLLKKLIAGPQTFAPFSPQKSKALGCVAMGKMPLRTEGMSNL
jgi:hypothetical protein